MGPARPAGPAAVRVRLPGGVEGPQAHQLLLELLPPVAGVTARTEGPSDQNTGLLLSRIAQPTYWEDEDKATNDVDQLRAEFRRRLYAAGETPAPPGDRNGPTPRREVGLRGETRRPRHPLGRAGAGRVYAPVASRQPRGSGGYPGGSRNPDNFL